MKLLPLFILSFTALQANAFECDSLNIDENKSVNGRYKYCFQTDSELNEFANLSRDDVTIFFDDDTSKIVYPFEYIIVPNQFYFQVGIEEQKFIERFDIDTYVLRDPKPRRSRRAAAIGSVVRLLGSNAARVGAAGGAKGALVGTIGAIGTAPNQSPSGRALTSGAVGGFVSGAAAPFIGGTAGGIVGVAAGGACYQCHE